MKRMARWIAVGCIILIALAGTASAMNVSEHTKHFDIAYSNPPSIPGTNGLGQTLENSYKEINDYYGSAPEHVKVLVVGKKTMDEVGQHVEAFSAWNKDSSAIVIREDTMKDKKALDVVTKHEISHLCINNILMNKESKQFSWMEEGICMVLSKEPFSDAKVSKYILGKGFLMPQEIADAINNDNYNITKDGYMQSYSLVKYIVRRFGVEALVDMLKCPETNFEKAFSEKTGEDFGTFYQQWKSFVRMSAFGPTMPGRPLYQYMKYDTDCPCQ
jgi:hypothetical protein